MTDVSTESIRTDDVISCQYVGKLEMQSVTGTSSLKPVF